MEEDIEVFQDPQNTTPSTPQKTTTRTKSAASTNPPYRRKPPHSEAHDWLEFKMGVLGRRPDNQTPRYNKYSFKTTRVPSEIQLQHCFMYNILEPLQRLFMDLEFNTSEAINMMGKPDFICLPAGQPNTLLMAIEIKTRWVLSGDTNLVGEYNQRKQPVVRSVEQIYGYLKLNNLRYGIISMYDITWFIKLSDDKELFISPPIKHDDTGPTLFECFAYIVLEASHKPTLPVYRTPPGNSPDNSSEGKGGADSTQGDGPPASRTRSQTKISRVGDGRLASWAGGRNHSAEVPQYIEVGPFEFQIINSLGIGRSGTVSRHFGMVKKLL